jgi:hypothetical protein
VKQLILKVVREDMTSHNGFRWPGVGETVRPELWDPTLECGNGLHGWLRGEGSYRHEFMDGRWIVFTAEEVVSLDGGDKCKAASGEVVLVGTRAEAVAYLIERGALTAESNPGWCCFSPDQLRDLAYRAANRSIHVYAPAAMRLIGHEDLALQLEAVPPITGQFSAEAADAAAARAAEAADAAAARAADAAARAAAWAADAAAEAAAEAAEAADAAAARAADAAAWAAEKEEQRLDRLELLGFARVKITP